MTISFAAAAGRLAGLVTRAFGWVPEQFWQATPAELAAIFATDDTLATTPLSRIELDTMMERETHD